ncbi:MAG: prolyl oligopeptidase family serine peptidase, partial [Halobacteriaceae archaeon]
MDLEKEPRVLVDPNTFEDETASMNWYDVDMEGERVAYGYDEGGEEQYDVRIIDVETGDLIDEVPDAGRVNPGGFAWTEDGFYYIQTGGPGGGSQLQKSLHYHVIGEDPNEDEMITDAFDEHAWPQLERDEETGTLLAAIHRGTTHSEIYLVDEEASKPLQPIITDVDATFRPHLNEGSVHFTSNYEAPFSRVLSISVDDISKGERIDPDALMVTVPETDGVLQSITFAGDQLVAHHLRDASSQLSIWNDSERCQTLPVPDHCTIAGLSGGDDQEIFYLVQSFRSPDEVTRYDLDSGQAHVLQSADVSYDVEIDVSQEFFVSNDGTEVPAFIVHRADLELTGDAPTVLYGYGGFRISQTPGFDRFREPFLKSGGVYVVANLRGGTEYGEEWHEAGMLENKQHVFDDYYAIAEGLIERGYTNSDRLAACGGSNGGLLTGV